VTDHGDQIGAELLGRLVSKLKHNWVAMAADARASVTEIAQIVGRLTIRKVAGEDVVEAVALASSVLRDWAWIGAEAVRGGLLTVAGEMLVWLGQILGPALVSIVSGLIA